MTEGYGGPSGLKSAATMASVGEQPPLARHTLELLGARGHMLEVGGEDLEAVALGDLEGEAAALVAGVLDCLDVVGPGEAVAGEGVGNRVVDVTVEVVDVNAAIAIAIELGDLEVSVWAEEVLQGLVEGVEE
ncbi:hypothetical protein Acr_14g0002630 [Actinidia rufa]|uniref:Uncharacterized protein n=1 Tax=Actinidia rufa TaxID=165716 RepID=A0A7J0FRS8_9ERIC|nr:hypothetical protein Acr_14g0002630 [Actinidia rufa]